MFAGEFRERQFVRFTPAKVQQVNEKRCGLESPNEIGNGLADGQRAKLWYTPVCMDVAWDAI
jgi:hypothetical protein